MRIEYKWDGSTRYVEASADEDVGWLHSKISKELGLPASQGLRLKCGTRDLRDEALISAIDATVHAMPGGGLAGGASAKRARTTSTEESIDDAPDVSPVHECLSDDEYSLNERGNPSSASPAASEAAEPSP